MNEFHGISIYDRPRRKKNFIVKDRKSFNAREKQIEQWPKRKNMFHQKGEKSDGQGERNYFNKREKTLEPPGCVATERKEKKHDGQGRKEKLN
jgi:hypothetical protein